MTPHLTLILGGCRAGKSRHAQDLAAAGGGRVLFVATAEALDEEMAVRIEAHRQSRPAAWDTLEEPLDLTGALAPVLTRYDTILLDCLTLWTSNLLLTSREPGARPIDIPAEVRRLFELSRSGTASWIVVSNEVGLGTIPDTELGRTYADELGG